MDNLEEMNKFLEKFNLPGLNQEEIEIVNNIIMGTEIEIVSSIFSDHNAMRLDINYKKKKNCKKRKHMEIKLHVSK